MMLKLNNMVCTLFSYITDLIKENQWTCIIVSTVKETTCIQIIVFLQYILHSLISLSNCK